MKPPGSADVQRTMTGWWCHRYTISLMCFTALMMSYIMRFCLSIAITEMVTPHVRVANSTVHHHDADTCPYPDNYLSANGGSSNSSSVIKSKGEFTWSEETQGIVLSSFFWGYVLTQMPGGQASERYGGKAILGLGIFISSLGTLATPIAARAGGAAALIAVRIIIGLGQGLVYPSLHCVTAQWIPTQERGRLGCFVFAGVNFGNMISMSLSGVILGLVEGGWPLIFYLYGVAGLVWCLIWYMFGYSSPKNHRNLSTSESELLDAYLRTVDAQHDKSTGTPWKEILKSWPMWGLVIGQIGHDWGLFTIVTDLPKYMKSVMHFTITQNGVLLGLPYLLMWIIAITSGWFTDWILAKKYISITMARKIFTTFASVGPSLGILGATYSGCDRGMVTAFFIAGIGVMGFFYPSLKVNALDLSPNFAGTISAFVIGIGAISGIITPYLVGLLTPNSTLLEWRLVFWIAVIVLIITNIVYLLFGSGEVQPWNSVSVPEREEKPEKKSEDGFSSIPL